MPITCGVLQSSIWGLILFFIHMLPLSQIMSTLVFPSTALLTTDKYTFPWGLVIQEA